MEEMLSSERSQMSAAQESRPRNLLTALVRASEEAKQSPKEDLSGQGLTDDEIFGNIFIYNLAGHETTANTLAFAIVLLAAEPEWQEWIAEEITQVLGDESTPQSWKYEQSFPRLGRCLAVMVCSPVRLLSARFQPLAHKYPSTRSSASTDQTSSSPKRSGLFPHPYGSTAKTILFHLARSRSPTCKPCIPALTRGAQTHSHGAQADGWRLRRLSPPGSSSLPQAPSCRGPVARAYVLVRSSRRSSSWPFWRCSSAANACGPFSGRARAQKWQGGACAILWRIPPSQRSRCRCAGRRTRFWSGGKRMRYRRRDLHDTHLSQ